MNVNKNSSLLGRYSAKEDIIFKNQNDEGTLLLLEKPKENTQILKDIGFDHYISEVEKEAHIKNSKIVIGQLFGKPAFLGSEIKKVCNDYDLVISKVSNYKGVPFQDLPEIIQAFIDANSSDVVIPAKMEIRNVIKEDENGKSLRDSEGNLILIEKEYEIKPSKTVKKSKIKTGYSNWFIMAPRESFSGNKKNTCCTLFYRDNEDSKNISENDVFTEVYSWGSNYSDIRKYNYFLTNIEWTKETELRNKELNQNEIAHQNISLILGLFFLVVLNVILYFYSFTRMCISTTLILGYLYLLLRKPCEGYYKLWKI